jgi:hypothetical protein
VNAKVRRLGVVAGRRHGRNNDVHATRSCRHVKGPFHVLMDPDKVWETSHLVSIKAFQHAYLPANAVDTHFVILQ